MLITSNNNKTNQIIIDNFNHEMPKKNNIEKRPQRNNRVFLFVFLTLPPAPSSPISTSRLEDVDILRIM